MTDVMYPPVRCADCGKFATYEDVVLCEDDDPTTGDFFYIHRLGVACNGSFRQGYDIYREITGRGSARGEADAE